MVLFVTILKDKVRESPITMATLLACIKSVLESSGIKERLFPNRIRFHHGDDTAFREYVVEFNSSCDRTFSEHDTNGTMVGIMSMTGAMDHYHEDDDEDTDELELEKDEILEAQHHQHQHQQHAGTRIEKE